MSASPHNVGSPMTGQQRTALISVGAAAALVLLKLVTGVITGSIGLISAGVESSGDVVAAILTVFAIRMAQRPADESHQYGHGRAENLSALAEALILAAGGAFIVTEAVGRLKGDAHPPDAAWYAFAVLAIAIAVDVSRTLISFRTARQYRSAALRSNAFHFAGDLVGTAAVLVGLLFVRAGYHSADSIAALAVSGLVFVAAGRLIWENANTLMDRVPGEAEQTARAAIESLDMPIELRRLRVRESGGRAFADVVVGVPPAAAVGQGHATADAIEEAVQRVLPKSDVVVHIEPSSNGHTLQERVLAAAQSVPRVREAHNVDVFRLGAREAVSLHLKLPEDVPLADAQRVADEVEEAIKREVPTIELVRAHLEPLGEPLPAAPLSKAESTELEDYIRRIAQERGVEIGDLQLLDTDRGVVVLLTVLVDAQATLADAHRLASEIEESLHAQPRVAEVVVATRPR
jgi:cation diffusion facilitator family transporter